MTAQQTGRLARYFPSSKKGWKTYFKIFFPALLGSMLFALNGFVDNFMVGHIPQGVTALSAVNSWTNILVGFFTGTAAAGSVVMAQLYHAKKYDLVQQVARLRLLLCLGGALLVSTIGWISPDSLIRVFLEGNKDFSYREANALANSYLKVIGIAWVLMAISFNCGNQLREIGHPRISVFWGMGTLLIHITLNAVLMYVFGLGVQSAAWASIVARCFAISVGTIYMIVKKLPIRFWFFTIFSISSQIWRSFFKRWFLLIAFTSTNFFVTFRNFFYDAGYPVLDHSPLGQGLGAMTILGLAGAILNIFTTSFNVLATMSSNFVAPELSKGNLKQAKINADQLKGFNTTMALSLSFLLIILAIFIPSMSFLSYGQNDQHYIDHHALLVQVRNNLFVIACWYPIWIFIYTSYRASVAGGKGFWFAFTDWTVSGPLELSYLSILVFVVLPHWPLQQQNFVVTFGLFYIMDILKVIFFELIYHKSNWAHKI